MSDSPYRTVAVRPRTARRRFLRHWSWTPVLGSKWATGCGGFTLTKAGAARAGRRWHRDHLRQIAHIHAPTTYYPATAQNEQSCCPQVAKTGVCYCQEDDRG